MAITSAELGALEIRVDQSDLDRLITSALSAPAQKRIHTRAINETTAWMKGRILRELPGATGIPRKVLSRRIRIARAKSNFNDVVSGKVWLGYQPVDPLLLSDQGPYGSGYMAGGFFFEKGFKAKMPSGKVAIFARTGSARNPIKRQFIRIDHQANEFVKRLIRPAEEALQQKLFRLLSWELER